MGDEEKKLSCHVTGVMMSPLVGILKSVSARPPTAAPSLFSALLGSSVVPDLTHKIVLQLICRMKIRAISLVVPEAVWGR